jgi:hypothetical protein
MLIQLSLAALIPFLTTLSLTQNEPAGTEARQAYDRGVTEYNLGRFDRAIVEFERAYQLDPDPMLLFNLAQAERRAGNARRAILLYERFISLAPSAQNVDNARRHLRELKAALPAETSPPEPAGTPPSEPEAVPPRPSPALEAQAARQPEMPVDEVRRPVADDRPLLLSAEFGLTRLDFGRQDLGQAIVFPLGASAQYRFPMGPVALVPGLSLTGTRFSEADRAGVARTLHLFGILASVGLALPATARLSLGPELAAGVLWWTGLDPGNRFTVDGAGASGGPVPLPTLRLGLPVEVAVSPAIVVAFRPTLVIARPGSGLRASVAWLTSVGVAAGIGVRF